jgi:hypothetical protein
LLIYAWSSWVSLCSHKRILRYIKGTLQFGLSFSRSQSHELVVYSNADWAGYPDTRRSTSGYCVFLGDNLISWSSKRQHIVSRSSAEAEYRGVANAVAEACWIRQLFGELRRPLTRATLVYCDNISVVFTKERNMWRLIYILFGSVWLLVLSEFFMSLHLSSMMIYLLKGCLLLSLLTFAPVSTFNPLRVETAGGY